MSSSMLPALPYSADGGNGWISFGYSVKSLPSTKMAPALFAVPQ
jgi:hypothetical protein